MANKLLVNTVFVEGEEPTAEKLNLLNTRVREGLELLAGAIVDLGGDDRVIDDSERTTELEVTASDTPDMNVHIGTGFACVSETICQNAAAATKSISAPTTSNRYTIVQISNEGVITTKNSAEAATPIEPSADTNNLKLAALYLPQNCTHINDSNQGQGFIIDRREIFALHPTTVTRHVTFTIFGLVDTAGGDGYGYYIGTVGSQGFTFGKAVTVDSAFISAQVAPVGDDIDMVIHNMATATGVIATLPDGLTYGEGVANPINFGASDPLAIQITSVGSSNPGGYLNIVLRYTLR